MISTNILTVIATIGATFGVASTVLSAIPFLIKKGVNVEKSIQNVEKGLTAADAVITVGSELLPTNPIVDALKVVEKYAHIGVNQAEQLYLSSQLPSEQRIVKAKETIQAALTSANITVTPELDKIIDGAIEAEVLALKTPEQKNNAELTQTKQQITALQTANTQLQKQVTILESTNTNLSNKLNNVQAVVTPPVVTTPVQ